MYFSTKNNRIGFALVYLQRSSNVSVCTSGKYNRKRARFFVIVVVFFFKAISLNCNDSHLRGSPYILVKFSDTLPSEISSYPTKLMFCDRNERLHTCR